jgi:type IV pilus assembly protein PilC
VQDIYARLIKSGLLIFGKVPSQDLSFSLYELSMLLSSGLNLTRALEIVASQTENRRLKEALFEIKAQVERGRSIPQAFESAGIFPEFLVEMLRVAERGENLEKVLHMAGEFLGRTAEARSKILTALAYPIFLISVSLISVLVVTRLVVPKIAGVLSGLGKELPLITKVLLALSGVVSYLVYLLPFALILLLFGRMLLTPERWDRWMLRLPVIGSLLLYFSLSRFASTLNMAIGSGIPITRAIKLCIGSLGNEYLKKALEGLEEEVFRGRSLSNALKDRHIFPEAFVSLLSIGERSGEMEKSLLMLEKLYESRAERVIGFWIRFAEPIAMLVVGSVVALVVLSVVLPLSEISAGVRR